MTMRTDDRGSGLAGIIALLAAFIGTAMVAGLIGAGLFMPSVGAAGATARSGVEFFDALPAELEQSPLAQQSRILDADGHVIATFYNENRIVVPLTKVAKIMQNAQIAIEDSRFREHGGVDPRGIARALVSNAQGGGVQGASTLTQQYVKLTLQENALRNNDEEAAQAAVRKSAARKIQEIKYAVTLEKEMTKDQILQGYFNLAYYGDLAYGVEAAARHYFSVSASKLNLGQAALLAGLVQNPGTTDPIHHPEKAQARRDVVLDRMHDLGIIKDKDWKAAKKVPVSKMLKVSYPKSNCAASTEPYFCNFVMAYLKDTSNHALDALGKTVPERTKNLTSGGLTIQTTLDPDTQKMALKQLTKRVPVGNKEGIGAAASIVEPGTGKVLAMVQNTTYTTGKGSQSKGLTAVNWNVDRKYGGENGFQFGSTAKMYAIVTALESGIPVNGTIPSKFATATKPAIYTPKDQGKCGSQKNWEVRNDYAAGGKPIPFAKATAQSINTAFASLVLSLGTPTVEKTMTRMGLHTGYGDNIPCTPASVTLGAGTTTPLTIASSYATLAADGKYCPPNPVLSITTNDKKPLKIGKTVCKQVIDPDIAEGATELLTNVIKNGTATAANIGRPAAGKTGTTDNHYQSWFVGYTPQLATAVWVGTPYKQFRMRNISLAGTYYGEVFGGTISAPLWHDIMSRASADLPVRDFGNPSDKVLKGDLVSVPYVSGMSVSEARARLEDAGFTVQVAGRTDSNLSEGLVVYTSPNGQALRGSTIGLYTSTGSVPKPKETTKPTPKPSKTKHGPQPPNPH